MIQYVLPISSVERDCYVLVKEYVQRDRMVRLFQSVHGELRYDWGNGKEAIRPLELEGVSKGAPTVFFQNTFARRVDYSDEESKLTIFHRGYGGGKYEACTGALVTGSGVAVMAAVGPTLAAAAMAGAAIGCGMEMMQVGCSRKEDRFDQHFSLSGVKGGLSGAVSGMLSGGLGGSIVRKIGARAVFSRQLIHAGANGVAGVLKTAVEAGIDSYSPDEAIQKGSKEKLSCRNLVANAVGAAAGGFAGAFAGKQVARIQDVYNRLGLAYLGGMAAGGAAGAAGGVVAGGVVNKCQGKSFSDNAKSSAYSGGASGALAGAVAATKVMNCHAKKVEQNLRKQKPLVSNKEEVTKKNVDSLSSSQKIRSKPSKFAKQQEQLEKAFYKTQKKLKKIEGMVDVVPQDSVAVQRLRMEMEIQRTYLSLLEDPERATDVILREARRLQPGHSLSIPIDTNGNIATIVSREDSVLLQEGARTWNFDLASEREFLALRSQVHETFTTIREEVVRPSLPPAQTSISTSITQEANLIADALPRVFTRVERNRLANIITGVDQLMEELDLPRIQQELEEVRQELDQFF